MLCGAFSSIFYTVTNICLRQVTHVDPVWVSAVKALPTLFIAVPLVFAMMLRGQRVFTTWRDVAWLVLTSLGVQIFGNVAFQWSLAILGLAISIPIVLGTMLVGGAIIGKIVLGEPVGKQKALAIVVLIVATCVLSYGAQAENAGSVLATAEVWQIPLALLGNITAGIAYTFLGTMMRRSMQAGMPLASTLFVLSSVGTMLLGSWTFYQVGWSGMVATSRGELWAMLLAGLFNALAFFAMAKSLQQVSVLYVQMLNASQTALAAAAGWLLFRETITPSIGLGLVLTAAGLIVAGFRPRRGIAKRPEPIPNTEDQQTAERDSFMNSA